MTDIVKPGLVVINDSNIHDYLPGGKHAGPSYGGLPRDYAAYPCGYLGAIAEPFHPSINDLFSDSEIEDRIEDQEKNQSSLEHVSERSGPNGGPIPSLDQNGQGYCWAYSTTMAVMLVRAADGLPYKRLSGHMVGCVVKGYRDEGGWNSQSLKFASEKGIASIETWAEKSMARGNETPAMWADAASNRVTEWWDIDLQDRGLVRRIQAYFLLSNVPYMADRNRWSHSTTDARLIGWNPLKIRGRNSWTDGWGNRGWFDMEGSMADVDGINAPRVTMAA